MLLLKPVNVTVCGIFIRMKMFFVQTLKHFLRMAFRMVLPDILVLLFWPQFENIWRNAFVNVTLFITGYYCIMQLMF